MESGIGGARSQAARWVAPTLRGSATAGDALLLCARSCQDHLAANLALLAAGDLEPEVVHQARVAVRRFRSLMNLFRPLSDTEESERLRAELKWLLGELGPLRDADVFLAELLVPVTAGRDDARLHALRDEVVRKRDAAAARARKALRSRRGKTVVAFAAEWAEGGDWRSGERAVLVADISAPARDYAARLLKTRFRKVRKAPASLAELSEAERHSVRILVKKLRYATDLLAPLYPRSSGRPFARRLSKLQDRLGALNDIHMGNTLLAAWLAERQDDAALCWAAGFLSGWHEARVPSLLASADKAWRKLRTADPFWE